MKKVYLQPRTDDVLLHAGELMIPGVNAGGGSPNSPYGEQPGDPKSAPVRLGMTYSI